MLPNSREATSARYFRFDVLGTASSPWNKSAARVFAKLAIRQLSLPNSYEMVQAIKKAFTAHLRTIMRRYKLSLKSRPERMQMKSLGRRQARKYQLFHQRRYLAYAFKPLRRHTAMLERLGVDGTSSDESDHETEEQTTYQILTPLWRAPHIAAWLRMFDSLHNILRKSGDSSASHGSFPRRRRVGQRRSTNIKFVPGLPLEVYDPGWIARDARRKYDLHPTTEQYEFSHQPDIVE
ncbi:hypothetical protein C8F04DRAFT_980230 [Mycena alexandri]|nr:hypothetical protein C8F04DRAFT_980230 [Mycena alexandri]